MLNDNETVENGKSEETEIPMWVVFMVNPVMVGQWTIHDGDKYVLRDSGVADFYIDGKIVSSCTHVVSIFNWDDVTEETKLKFGMIAKEKEDIPKEEEKPAVNETPEKVEPLEFHTPYRVYGNSVLGIDNAKIFDDLTGICHSQFSELEVELTVEGEAQFKIFTAYMNRYSIYTKHLFGLIKSPVTSKISKIKFIKDLRDI